MFHICSVQYNSHQPQRALEMWLVQLRNWIFILISLNPNSHMWLVTTILYSTASRKLWIQMSSIEHILLNLLCHNSSVSVWNLEALFFFIQSAHSAIHFLHLIISYASELFISTHIFSKRLQTPGVQEPRLPQFCMPQWAYYSTLHIISTECLQIIMIAPSHFSFENILWWHTFLSTALCPGIT